ncbi:MAG: ATPase [Planctomycetota bacterium]|nr:MAG: ATPase [Planctomycetota bacterium]
MKTAVFTPGFRRLTGYISSWGILLAFSLLGAPAAFGQSQFSVSPSDVHQPITHPEFPLYVAGAPDRPMLEPAAPNPPVPLQEQLEARVQEIEKQLAAQKEADAKAKAAAKSKPTFKLGGRIHFDHWGFLDNEPGIGYLEHPDPADPSFGLDPEDRFVFRRIRMEFKGDIPDNMEWRMQIDFNNPNSPEYKDLYFGWKNLPGNHTLLIGNQKRPLGLDHLNSSRFNVFAERPFVVESFNEDARRIGMCLYGHRNDDSANWRLGIFNLENTSRDGRYIGDSMQMGGYGRWAATPWYDEASGGRGYFHWAIAGAVAHPDGNPLPGSTNANEARFRTRPLARSDSRWLDTGRIPGANWYEILAVESVLNLGSLQITGEYMANFMQRDNVTPGTGPDLFFHGFYVYAAYFLTGEHMAWNRRTGTLDRAKPFENFFLVNRLCGRGGLGGGWGAWQIAGRYDFIDLTDEDIRGGVGHSYTLGLNWYWTAYSKVQTNLIFGDIKDHALVNGFDGGNYTILGTRFMADF